MNDIFEVANWFLSTEPTTQMKLQKLCYYAQAWSYALYNKPFVDDEFQAWAQGPMSPTLYDKYKDCGIDCLHPDAPVTDFCTEDAVLLVSVWKTYGEYTGNALEALSQTEPPWIKARNSHEHPITAISPQDMQDYFRSIFIGEL
jgi:uncharacterized phage-associated protein